MTELATRTLLVRSIPFGTLVGLGARIGIAGGGVLGVLYAVALATGLGVREGGESGILTTNWLSHLVIWPLFAGGLGAITAACAYVPLKLWMSKGMPVRLSFEVVVRPSERGGPRSEPV